MQQPSAPTTHPATPTEVTPLDAAGAIKWLAQAQADGLGPGELLPGELRLSCRATVRARRRHGALTFCDLALLLPLDSPAKARPLPAIQLVLRRDVFEGGEAVLGMLAAVLRPGSEVACVGVPGGCDGAGRLSLYATSARLTACDPTPASVTRLLGLVAEGSLVHEAAAAALSCQQGELDEVRAWPGRRSPLGRFDWAFPLQRLFLPTKLRSATDCASSYVWRRQSVPPHPSPPGRFVVADCAAASCAASPHFCDLS
jgi:hypothetical protein